MTTYNQLSDAGDGTILGQSTSDLISFYGYAPVAQRSGSVQASFSASVSISISSGYGFATQAQADAIIASVVEMRATLVALGLWKGGA